MSKELVKELKATFKYHVDGYLIRRSTGKPCGRRANTPKGYARIGVNGRMLFVHRIIYAINHGEMPTDQIDHIDRNPMNNRIENLRDVSNSENQRNAKMRRTNTSSFPGVHYHAPLRKWQARIQVNKRRISLGLFEDFDDAVRARKMAKIKYHPSSPEASKFALELFPCGA